MCAHRPLCHPAQHNGEHLHLYFCSTIKSVDSEVNLHKLSLLSFVSHQKMVTTAVQPSGDRVE